MGLRDRVTPHSLRDWALFVLGSVLIIDAAFGRGSLDRIVEITVGLLLIGIIPVGDVLDRIFRNGGSKKPDEPAS